MMKNTHVCDSEAEVLIIVLFYWLFENTFGWFLACYDFSPNFQNPGLKSTLNWLPKASRVRKNQPQKTFMKVINCYFFVDNFAYPRSCRRATRRARNASWIW